jgi:thiol-disulfide isomerase/thioredoxin
MPDALTSCGAIRATLASNASFLVVIDFWARWCGPCVRFAPAYDALSQDAAFAGKAKFFKVEDVVLKSENDESYAIRGLPCFM